MKLRKLHEVSLWKKLNDTDFKNKAIDFILEQQQIINDLIKTTTDLKEEIDLIKKHAKIINLRNYRMSRHIRNTTELIQTEENQNAIKSK